MTIKPVIYVYLVQELRAHNTTLICPGVCCVFIDKHRRFKVPGKNFTQVLEELDSSRNYFGTPLEGLDAYQRQLNRYAIKVSGPESSPVESFFQSSGSAVLFPEYMTRAVRQGMENVNKISDMVAAVTKIDALDYRSISAGADEATESTELSKTNITTSSGLVEMRKRGRMLTASYETLRFQKLDLLTVAMRQIGAYIAYAIANDAVDVLVNGDGNKAGIDFTPGCKPDYADFISLWAKLSPYSLNTVVVGTAAMQKLLNVPEFKDNQAGMNFQGIGNQRSFLGAKLVHVPGMDEHKILALDKNCALEMVQFGDIATDYDKLIDRQMERAAISVTAGFARIFEGAAVGLEC